MHHTSVYLADIIPTSYLVFEVVIKSIRPYHDVFGGQHQVRDEGLHGVQELHAARDVHREPQRLVLVYYDT